MNKKFEIDAFDKSWLFGFSELRERSSSPSSSLLNYLINNHPCLFPGKGVEDCEVFLHSLKIKYKLSSVENISLLFGCNKRTVLSWASDPSSIRPINKRLMRAIKDLCELSSHDRNLNHSPQKYCVENNGIKIWKSIVDDEAKSRGIVHLFKSRSWRTKNSEKNVDRITGRDIDSVRKKLGLSVIEACWVYGMEPKVWKIQMRNSMNEEVNGISYCLMTRFLNRYPDLCPLVPCIGFKELTEQTGLIDPSMCSKKMAALLGCEGSSGVRWMKNEQAMDSGIVNLMRMVKEYIFEGYDQTNPESIRKNISRWEGVVLSESEKRGVDGLMKKFRWA